MSLDEVTRRLYATTDAMVWAEEWCRIAREIEAADDGRRVVDEGWMVGWFANAMVVAADEARSVGRAEGYQEAMMNFSTEP